MNPVHPVVPGECVLFLGMFPVVYNHSDTNTVFVHDIFYFVI